jgi:DNA-binding LacI/PurR family transcriptional regulator
MSPPNRVTRLDVARKAKVSLATVTYALNPTGKLRISIKTQARIRDIAAQMGYRPNYVHRALSAGKTYSVGLIVPDSKALLFPLYEMIIDGCVDRMNADKYDPLLLLRSRWERVSQVVRDGRVDGLILVQSDGEDRYIREAAALGVPVVVLNRDLPADLPEKRSACVYADHQHMLADVVDEFKALGCRNILNFSSSAGTFTNRVYFDAFNEAMAAQSASGLIGSTIAPIWKDFKLQAEGLFATPLRWDGIFVDGAPTADELIRVAAEAGRVPGRDFHLIAADAYPESESYAVQPARLRRERAVYWQPAREVGHAGWRMMSALIAGESVPVTTRVPYVREAFDGRRTTDPLPETTGGIIYAKRV